MNKRSMYRSNMAGFTFIELMVAIAIVAILITAAVPSLQKIIRDSRVSSQANEIVALINLTRNRAIREGIDANDDDVAELRLNRTTTSGWRGNVRVTAAATVDEEPPVGCPENIDPDVIRCSENTNVDLTTGDATFSFESRGYLAPFQETFICLKHTGENCTGTRQHVKIRILGSGQIHTSGLACDATCGGTEG